MPEINSNDVENQTPASSSTLWSYAQTFLKGVGILSIGGITYAWARHLLTTDTPTESSQQALSATQSNVDFVLQAFNSDSEKQADIRFPVKRDVLPLTDKLLIGTSTAPKIASGITTLTTGEFVVTWLENQQTGNTLYAQRFSSGAIALDSQFKIVTSAATSTSGITSLNNGGFAVAWLATDNFGLSRLYLGIYDNLGSLIANPILITDDVVSNFGDEAITTFSNGRFAITWGITTSIEGTLVNNIYAKIFANNGIVLQQDFLVTSYNVTDAEMAFANIVQLANDEFVVAWPRIVATQNYSIYAQSFTEEGTILGPTFLIGNGKSSYPTLTKLSDNQFIVASTIQTQVSTYNSDSTYAQIFTTAGASLGNKFLISQNITVTSNILGLTNNKFVVAWYKASYDADIQTYSNSINAQVYASNGLPIGPSYLVAEHNEIYQAYNNITVLLPSYFLSATKNDEFKIIWQTQRSIAQSAVVYGYDSYSSSYTASYQATELVENALDIKQNQIITLGKANLLAYGINYENLIFLASNITNGYFTKINQIETITTFTQAELFNSSIIFTHDNSYSPPSYVITVSDGVNITSSQVVTVTFKNKPQFFANQFSIANGKSITLTTDNLLAFNYQKSKIAYTVKDITHGVFTTTNFTGSLLNPIFFFTQSDINASQITFVHDGSNQAPTYLIQAYDDELAADFLAGNVAFQASSNNANRNKIIGAAVGASAGALLLAGLGIFGGYRYKKAKNYAEERAKYPLADALYKALPIDGVENFKSAKGVAFVNAVNAIKGYLKADTQQMIPEELTVLANKLARAIKAQVNHTTRLLGDVELNLADVEYQAEAIAQTTQTLNSGGVLTSSADEIEMASLSKKNGLGRLASRLESQGIDMQHMKPAQIDKLADTLVAMIGEQTNEAIRMSH